MFGGIPDDHSLVSDIDIDDIDLGIEVLKVFIERADNKTPIKPLTPLAQLDPNVLHPRSVSEQARKEMKEFAIHHYLLFVDFLNETDAVKAFNSQQNYLKSTRQDYQEHKKLPNPVPPYLNAGGVGMGKTTLHKKIHELAVRDNVPLRIGASQHNLLEEIAKKCAGIAYARGRVSENNDYGMKENICFKMSDVEEAGKSNHPIVAALCRDKCEHGQAGKHKKAMSKKESDSKDVRETAREEILQVIGWFDKKELKLKGTKPCPYLYEGLPKMLSRRQSLIAVQMFSPAWGLYSPGLHEDKIQSYLVVDEKQALTKEVEIRVLDVDQWLWNIKKLQKRLKKNIKKEKRFNEDGEPILELIDIIPQIIEVFQDLIIAITKGEKIILSKPIVKKNDEAKIIKTLGDRILELQRLVTLVKASTGGTAEWESIIQIDDDYIMPLRALNTLCINIKEGWLRKSDGCIYVYEMTQLLKWAIDKGGVMFMDATASDVTKSFIRSLGGEVFERKIEQNIHVTMVSGQLYARGRVPQDVNAIKKLLKSIKVKKGKLKIVTSKFKKSKKENIDPDDVRKIGESYREMCRTFMRELEAIAKKLKKGWSGERAIITHLAFLKYFEEGKSPEEVAKEFEERTGGCKLGWFGKHDRGHNDWDEHAMAIVGMPLVSSDSIAGLWGGTRATLIQAGVPDADAEIWDEVMQAADAVERDGGVHLPDEGAVRAFIIGEYAATVAQCIGRARGLNWEGDQPIPILIYGGLQNAEMREALLKFGITIHADEINDVHRTKEEYQSRGSPDLDKVPAALQAVIDAKLELNKDRVRAELVKMGGSASNGVLSGCIKDYKEQQNKIAADSLLNP